MRFRSEAQQQLARAIIAKYLESERNHNPHYYREIQQTAVALGPLAPTKKLVVVIPVHSSERSLERLLALYQQQTIPDDRIEIILFVNQSEGLDASADFRRLRNEVENATTKGTHTIRFVERSFARKTTLGYIRKYICDSILLRTQSPERLWFLNTDADVEFMDATYLAEIDAKRKMNTVLYRISDVPAWTNQYPTFSRLLRFYQAIDRGYNQLSSTQIPIRFFGYNANLPATTYCAAGGWPASVAVGEDLTLAHCISTQLLPKSQFLELTSPYTTSCRRLVQAFIRRVPFYDVYGSFADSDDLRQSSPEILEHHLARAEQTTPPHYYEAEVANFFTYFLQYRLTPFFEKADSQNTPGIDTLPLYQTLQEGIDLFRNVHRSISDPR